MVTSGNDDEAALGFLVAAAIAIFETISKTLPGFFNTSVANFLLFLAGIPPDYLGKPPSPSACIVLSKTVIDFFLLQNEQKPISNLLCLLVITT